MHGPVKYPSIVDNQQTWQDHHKRLIDTRSELEVGLFGNKRKLASQQHSTTTMQIWEVPYEINQLDSCSKIEVSGLQNIHKKDDFKTANRQCHLNWETATKTVTQIPSLELAFMNL
jgi:hypothetical protein